MKKYSRRPRIRAAFNKVKQAQGLRPSIKIPPANYQPSDNILSQNNNSLLIPTETPTKVPTLLPPTAAPTATATPTEIPTLLPPTATPTATPVPPPLSISPILPINRLDLPQYAGTADYNVVLSFDDGPDLERTPQLLNLLKAHDVKAVFFVLGKLLEYDKYQEVIRRAYNEGHIIGNHSHSHADLTTLEDAYVRWELNRTQELIGEFGHEKRPMRPPYGAMDNRVFNIMVGEGYTGVLWNVDSRDWHYGDTAGWIEGTLEEVQQHQDSMIVFHDTRDNTINYIEYFIQRVRSIPKAQIVPFLSNEFNHNVWNTPAKPHVPHD